MKKTLLLLLLISFGCQKKLTKKTDDFTTLFETSNGTETPEYKDVISFYQKLATNYPEVSLFEMGETDSGKPLHLIVFNADGKIDLKKLKDSSKNRILINNGIQRGVTVKTT